MKKIHLSLIFLALIASTQAQVYNTDFFSKASELKTNVVGSYPTEVWEYQWLVEYWKVFQKKNISYSSFGEPTDITVIGEDGDSYSQFTYNSEQKLIQKIEQKKEGGVWVNNRREVTDFDGDGNMNSHLVESWDGSNWVLTVGYQYNYSFDSDMRLSTLLTRIWSRESDSWINSEQVTYSYHEDNALIIGLLTKSWSDGVWVNNSNIRQDYTGDKINEVWMSGWKDNAWLESTNIRYQYSDYGSVTETNYTGAGDGNWNPSQRFVKNRDTHGNSILSTVEIFVEDWMKLSGVEYVLTYDGDNLVERITKSFSRGIPGTKGQSMGETWKNVRKEEFKDFASLSIWPVLFDEVSIDHFPNPARGSVCLRLKNLQGSNLILSVVELTGKLVHQEKLNVPANQSMHIVNLEHLPQGILIFQIRDNSGKLVSSSRVIHQK